MNEVKPQVRVGVAIYIVRPSDGHILMTHRIGKHGTNTWAPPGGHQEFGESPAQTAVREAFEEVGLRLEEKDITFLGFTNDVFEETNKHYVTLAHVAVLPTGQEPKNIEPESFSELRWCSIDELASPLFLSVQRFIDNKETRTAFETYVKQVGKSYAA